MKYYTVIIQHAWDSTYAQAIYMFDTLNEAKSRFHTEMASALVSKNLLTTSFVVDENGRVYLNEQCIKDAASNDK